VTETNGPGPFDAPADDAQPPLLSIILPTYNGAKYLAEAIESCLTQTYSAWELIVVDDCSTDTTPTIIARYAARDRRIRVIRHEVNRKVPGALNTGHAAARGIYLTWTSDDNRFLASAIEEMAGFLSGHPAVGMVVGDSVMIDERGDYVRNYPAQPASRLAYINALGPCFMYRRSVYETIGPYDPELFLAEDYDYWLRIYRQFEIARLNKVLYEFRWHDQSLTNTTRPAALRASVEKTLRRHLPYLHRSSPRERARGWIVCAAAAVRRGALGQAAGALSRALRAAPAFSVWYVVKRVADRLLPRSP
jgi:glycosyltransferase involved in cell wall biosynthesis